MSFTPSSLSLFLLFHNVQLAAAMPLGKWSEFDFNPPHWVWIIYMYFQRSLSMWHFWIQSDCRNYILMYWLSWRAIFLEKESCLKCSMQIWKKKTVQQLCTCITPFLMVHNVIINVTCQQIIYDLKASLHLEIMSLCLNALLCERKTWLPLIKTMSSEKRLLLKYILQINKLAVS